MVESDMEHNLGPVADVHAEEKTAACELGDYLHAILLLSRHLSVTFVARYGNNTPANELPNEVENISNISEERTAGRKLLGHKQLEALDGRKHQPLICFNG
jgi:hypothetical protein